MKTIGKIILFLICIIIIGTISINLYMISYSNKYIIDIDTYKELDGLDCIIVLGSGMVGDKPTPILEDRLIKGIELYNLGVTNKILMSGDHGRVEHDEVNLMKKYAIETGVPSNNIFMDHAGFSTYETMYRAKEIFKVEKVVLVTQEYHMYRSIYIARKMGIEAYGVTTDNLKGDKYREAREVLARNKDFFSVIIKPKPKFLGEEIPISGDGNLTNDKDIEKSEIDE